MEIITIFKDEKFLRQASTEVDFEKDDLNDCIKKLKEYCSSNSIYALAPVQIGIPKRLIYIKNSQQDMNNNSLSGYDEALVYINPKIIDQKGHTRFLEACESCSYEDNGTRIYYAGLVDRPYSVDIEYYDLNGNFHKKSLEGFESTVFCHEYDHLNGILHIDKVDKIFKYNPEEIKEYRRNNPQEILSKDCDYI